jgi:hypothetical protein
MTEASESNRVLVDNWLLESAGVMLSPVETADWVRTLTKQVRPERGASMTRDAVQALVHLLDIIVLHDDIVYREPYSSTWRHRPSLLPLRPFLSGHVVLAEEQRIVGEELKNLSGDEHSSIVAAGARTFLATARVLGISYWPSPARAEYLGRVWPSPATFTASLQAAVDVGASQSVAELHTALGRETSSIAFLGFGASILGQCSTVAEALPIALEHRGSRAARGFRKWSTEMDRALASENYVAVARGVRDFKDALADARRSLGLDDSKDALPTITLKLDQPLSPGLSVGAGTLVRGLRRWRPHVVFLRQHFERALRGGSVAATTRRLFPDVTNAFEIVT